MIKRVFFSKLIFMLSLLCLGANSRTIGQDLHENELIYELTPVFNANELRFSVYLAFKGDSRRLEH